MIVLDTNVVSALMRERGATAVVSWLDRQPTDLIWTSAITIFEIGLGIETLCQGKRRRSLEEAFARTIEEDLGGQILPFEAAAARHAAALASRRRSRGRPIDFRDVMIAGVVAAKDAVLATRNIRDFDGLGINLVDPWTDPLP
jgi:hypothetical protein